MPRSASLSPGFWFSVAGLGAVVCTGVYALHLRLQPEARISIQETPQQVPTLQAAWPQGEVSCTLPLYNVVTNFGKEPFRPVMEGSLTLDAIEKLFGPVFFNSSAYSEGFGTQELKLMPDPDTDTNKSTFLLSWKGQADGHQDPFMPVLTVHGYAQLKNEWIRKCWMESKAKPASFFIYGRPKDVPTLFEIGGVRTAGSDRLCLKKVFWIADPFRSDFEEKLIGFRSGLKNLWGDEKSFLQALMEREPDKGLRSYLQARFASQEPPAPGKR